MDVLLGLLSGVTLTYWAMTFFNKKKGLEKIEHQSIILVEKIKSVCKLISVEGDFAEIYHYENTKNRFFQMITGTKKAVLLVNAKVHVGYDLSQIKLESNNLRKEIKLTHFPEPQVLTIETDVKYYDKKEGFFNKFKPTDLTELHKGAKNFIIEKIPESGLLETAKKEALDTILMIEKMIETSGWKLNYEQLKLPENNPKKLTKPE